MKDNCTEKTLSTIVKSNLADYFGQVLTREVIDSLTLRIAETLSHAIEKSNE